MDSARTVRRAIRRPVAIAGAVLVTAALAFGAAGVAAGGSGPPAGDRFTAAPIQPDGASIESAKSGTGQLAQTDPSLLGRTDDTPINVMVKLDYDSVATYGGNEPGLPATSPAVTGEDLQDNAAAVAAYESHVAEVEAAITQAILAAVPEAEVRESFRVAYGGLAMRVPANAVGALLAVDGVVAVQQDGLVQTLTDSTPAFLGATNVYPQLGGPSNAGEGVIVGVLDTGIWPEHPSFADPGIGHPGGTYACEFGLSGQVGDDPFECNDKLIGAYAFTDTYLEVLGAEPGEFCDVAAGVCSARDADGHGTHTASTAAGGPVASAPLFGIERGPISGIAPGAHVIMYRVCLDQGCFQSDSVAAIQQAIVDGVDVINFSIAGGASPFTDSVELAFLEAFAAGIVVNASAGNAGPGAGTADHGGPWVNTVGAATSNRHFLTTVELAAGGGATLSVTGASVTPGIDSPTPVALATDLGGDALCSTPLAAGSAAGKVVVCEGARNRNLKSFNVMQGGAAGMLLTNPGNLDLFTDNFWIPTVMLPPAAAAELLAFLASSGDETATWAPAAPTAVQSDRTTAFSSRGPVGDFLKPDVIAPGSQILAGTTPQPWPGAIHAGPPGQLFQAISGTSMSSPHAAGVSALVRAAHPDWTPAQVKSALMTSSLQTVVKEDGVTPADPFDRGAGSIRADLAVASPVTFDVTADDYAAAANDPLSRIHLNLPSINAPRMAGEVTTERTFVNVSGDRQKFTVEAEAPAGATIEVRPERMSLNPGQKQRMQITIDGKLLPTGQQFFGQITLVSESGARVAIPVAFFTAQGDVVLDHACNPTTIPRQGTAECVIVATNTSALPSSTAIDLQPGLPGRLRLANVTGGATPTGRGFEWSGVLAGARGPEIVSITPGGSPAGYLPLSLFGIDPIGGVGDETITNFNVPAFKYGSEVYTRVGMVSNGYLVVGGGTSSDVDFVPQTLPDPFAPNNVLAPYWTDLDAGSGGAMRVGLLTDGVSTWIVFEWENVPLYGTTTPRTFQAWIQIGDTESITYAMGGVGPGDATFGLTVGAENRDGTSGVNLGAVPVSGGDYTITTAPPQPGGSVTIEYDAIARNRLGPVDLIATMTSDIVSGRTTAVQTITVAKAVR
jgi:subtilisin family serine protease